jgi:hypothetical protein
LVGTSLYKKDRLYGVVTPFCANNVIYLASCVIYKRFLYNINSGILDYDLVERFRERLFGLLYFDFSNAKINGSIEKFLSFCNSGSGIFEILNDDLKIVC